MCILTSTSGTRRNDKEYFFYSRPPLARDNSRLRYYFIFLPRIGLVKIRARARNNRKKKQNVFSLSLSLARALFLDSTMTRLRAAFNVYDVKVRREEKEQKIQEGELKGRKARWGRKGWGHGARRRGLYRAAFYIPRFLHRTGYIPPFPSAASQMKHEKSPAESRCDRLIFKKKERAKERERRNGSSRKELARSFEQQS